MLATPRYISEVINNTGMELALSGMDIS